MSQPSRSIRTDDELVRSVLAGDRERFGELVERYQTRLVNYLYRMVRNLDDAHDLAQEVFIRVYQALDRYDSQYRFSTWLFRVAQNAAIDVIRKRRDPARAAHRGAPTRAAKRRSISSCRTDEPSALDGLEGRERDASIRVGDRRAALGVPRADPAAALRRARLRGDRRGQGDAARHGQEQAVPRAPDVEAAAARLSAQGIGPGKARP